MENDSHNELDSIASDFGSIGLSIAQGTLLAGFLYVYKDNWIDVSRNLPVSTAGVVVSCKIPILATRVRFPGGARTFSLDFARIF